MSAIFESTTVPGIRVRLRLLLWLWPFKQWGICLAKNETELSGSNNGSTTATGKPQTDAETDTAIRA